MAEDEYITVTQAARMSGLSAGHIARLLRDGHLVGIKPGHDWLVRESAVIAYLREGRRPGRPPKEREEAG